MAKSKASAVQRQQATPRRHSRHVDDERRQQLFIIGGVALVLLIVVGFIIFGWYQTQIKPLGKTVLTVEDREVTLGELERRMRLYREQNPQFAQRSEAVLVLPTIVMNDLEREAILLAGAPEIKVEITDEDVNARIRETGSLAENVDPTVFAEEYRNQVEESGLHRSEYDNMLRAEIASEKVLAYFNFLAPVDEPQVRAQWIVLEDQAAADAALERLNGGEEFSTVASDVSSDTQTKDTGGVIDWTPRGTRPAEVDQYLFSEDTETGQRSEILEVGDFFYIVELLDKDDARELDETQRQVVANRQMEEWIETIRGTLAYERNITVEDEAKALEDIY
jgi:parvulin-like peptidyl-prolyl isomerase